jgi:PiT family inorganic phosphate transporter
MIFAGPVRAMTWNLITWWFGVPSTSSHALIGAVIACVGTSAIEPGSILSSVIIQALIAPRAVTVVSVLIVAAAVITGIYFITDK